MRSGRVLDDLARLLANVGRASRISQDGKLVVNTLDRVGDQVVVLHGLQRQVETDPEPKLARPHAGAQHHGFSTHVALPGPHPDSAALLADLLRPPDAPTLLLLVGYRSEDADSPCVNVLRQAITAPSSALDTGVLEHHELAVEPLSPEEGRDLVLTLVDSTTSAAASQV